MKRLIASITFILALAACTQVAEAPPEPEHLQLDGIYGGYMLYSGQTMAAFAVEVSTTDKGIMSGYGAITFDGYNTIALDAWGNTTTDDGVFLTLEDSYGDSLKLSGGWDGTHARGTWRTSWDNTTGSFVFTHEDDVDTLAAGELVQMIAVNPGSPPEGGPLDANGSIREAMEGP